MPAFDGGDDFVWVSSPCEGLWHLVCLGDEAVDGDSEERVNSDGQPKASHNDLPIDVAGVLGSSEHGSPSGGRYSVTAAQTSTHGQPQAIRGTSRRQEHMVTAGARRGQLVQRLQPGCYNDRYGFPQSTGQLRDWLAL